MAILNTKSRAALPDGAFALPGRKYPIHDKGHAQAALSRVSQFGSDSEKAIVRAKVHARYPDMGQK